MERRNQKYARELGQIFGLRNFIEKAELPKLNLLVEEDPSYFYNILPYAYVMGLTDKWIKQFENIAVPPADWYDAEDDLLGRLYWLEMMERIEEAEYVYVLFLQCDIEQYRKQRRLRRNELQLGRRRLQRRRLRRRRRRRVVNI